jgi:hypothetical protein
LASILQRDDARPFICYCDTDSVFFHSGFRLPESDALGDFSTEDGYPVDSAVFIRAKMYRSGEKIKIKGVPHATPENFSSLLDKRLIHLRLFTKLRRSTRRGVPINSIYIMDKNHDLEDKKRCWPRLFDPQTLQDSHPHKATQTWYASPPAGKQARPKTDQSAEEEKPAQFRTTRDQIDRYKTHQQSTPC